MRLEANYRLDLQYDGRPFRGWQRQPNGPTVQEKLEEAISQVFLARCTVHGAGRTDAGVHAAGQVAGVRLPTDMEGPTIARALNANLPPEIRLTSVRRAREDFHARLHATSKLYRYLIVTGAQRSPFAPFYASWVDHPLGLEAMRGSARFLLGRHDFRSFQAAGGSVESTEREIKSLEIKRGGGMISITIRGDGFLRQMVRIIVGTLLEVGRGKRQPEEMAAIIAARDRTGAGPTAPACGLTLVRVDY